MKILQVIEYFTPKRGGSVNSVYNLSKELAKNGHEVTIITTDFQFDKKYAETIHDEGVEVIPFPYNFNIGLFLYSPKIKSWLKENIKDFDIVHMHNFRSYQNSVVYRYAKKYNVRYILQAHGSVLPFFAKIELKKIYDLIWGKRILQYSSRFIAVSNNEVTQYKEMGIESEKLIVIPNGIEVVSENEKKQEKGYFRKKYRISDDFLILYLGRIHKIKGIDFLIQAFKKLTNKISNIHLVIIGPDDGYYNNMIEIIKNNKLEDKITLVGFLDGTEKYAAYYDSDVFVYPSKYEIFGMSPFEAIQFDTPIIVSDGCGCGDYIKTANCGKVVRYNDIDDLVENIQLLINDHNLSTCFIENGKKFIANNLTWEKISKKVELVYEDCICHF